MDIKNNISMKVVVVCVLIIVIVIGVLFIFKYPFNKNEQNDLVVNYQNLTEEEEKGPDNTNISSQRGLVNALLKDELSICEYEENVIGCKDEFYLLKSIATNENSCFKINNDETKGLCNGILADDASQCSLLSNNMNIFCSVAYDYDVSRCDNIIEPDLDEKEHLINYCKDYPYLVNALRNNDIALCDKISDYDDDNAKKLCIDYLSQ